MYSSTLLHHFPTQTFIYRIKSMSSFALHIKPSMAQPLLSPAAGIFPPTFLPGRPATSFTPVSLKVLFFWSGTFPPPDHPKISLLFFFPWEFYSTLPPLNGHRHTLLMGKIMHPLSWLYLSKSHMHIPFNPAIPLWGN